MPLFTLKNKPLSVFEVFYRVKDPLSFKWETKLRWLHRKRLQHVNIECHSSIALSAKLRFVQITF